MKVCVLLLSVDEAPMLAWSLPAAVAQEPAAEVVVVDNASSDETGALAARHGAHHLHLERRLTYAAAINEALRRTDGDAVLLLNADCRLRPGFLAAAVPRLAEPGVGSVAPKLLRVDRASLDGPEWQSPAHGPERQPPARAAGPERQSPARSPPDQIDTAAMVIDRRRKNGLVGHGRPARAYGRPAPVFGADGAAALYRRDALAQCALGSHEVLDEDMELWASDADLAWRAQLLGWRSVYEPSAVAEHVRSYSPSTRAQMSEAARRLQFRNRYLMMIKNETAVGVARDLPWIAGYEVLALGHVLLRERHLLGGYRDAWRLRGAAWRRRAEIQERRRRLAARPRWRARPPFGLRAPE